eukprot:g44186.t1
MAQQKDPTGLMAGLSLLGEGVMNALQMPQLFDFYRSFLSYYLWAFIPCYLLSSLVMLILYIVLFLLLFLLAFIPGVPNDLPHYLPTARDIVYSMAILMSWLVPFFLRVAKAEEVDELFFKALERLEPQLANQLRNTPYPSLGTRLYAMLPRVGRFVLFAATLRLLGFLPLFGPFVFVAYQVFLTYDSLGPVLCVCCSLLNLAPVASFRQASKGLISLAYATKGLTRELLDPYLMREKELARLAEEAEEEERLEDVSQPGLAGDQPGQERARAGGARADGIGSSPKLSKYTFLWLGNALPLVMLLGVPVLGPLAFPFVQTAVAPLALRIHRLEAAKRR